MPAGVLAIFCPRVGGGVERSLGTFHLQLMSITLCPVLIPYSSSLFLNNPNSWAHSGSSKMLLPDLLWGDDLSKRLPG